MGSGTQIRRSDMTEGAAKRRKYYLEKIKEAERIAAGATSPETVSEMKIVIEAYCTLLAQLRPYAVTDSKLELV